MKRFCFAIFFSLAVCSYAADSKEELARRLQQYNQSLVALSAKLIVSNPDLKKLNHELKVKQQKIYLGVQADSEIKALAPLKTSDPIKYQREYARIRLKIIRENHELRQEKKEVHRLQSQMARILNAHPGVATLNKHLADTRARLAK